jgi:hypothetical protein
MLIWNLMRISCRAKRHRISVYPSAYFPNCKQCRQEKTHRVATVGFGFPNLNWQMPQSIDLNKNPDFINY